MQRSLKRCLIHPILRNNAQLLPNLLGKDISKAPSACNLLQRNLNLLNRPILRKRELFLPSLMGKRTIIAPSGTLLEQQCGAREGKLSPKMKNLMKKFQKDDGQPVFLKGGPMDNILYRLTVALAIIGLILNFVLFFGYILA